MRDNGKNGKKHNDPHRDLHAGTGGAQTDRAKNHMDTPMNASGVTFGGKEPSMGGSQGTRAEARNETHGDKHRSSASDSRQSASSREGGYGADSGYSDAPDKSRDDPRSGESAKRPNPKNVRSGSE
jgi:hypothetical protein